MALWAQTLFYFLMADTALWYYGYDIPVGHEIVELQKYNGEPCNDDINYQLDKCRLEYIQRVSQTAIWFWTECCEKKIICSI